MAYRAAGDATIREKNKFLYRDPDNPDAVPEVVMPKGGFYNTTNNILKSYYFRVSGNYNRLIANEHPFNIMAGSEVKSATASPVLTTDTGSNGIVAVRLS